MSSGPPLLCPQSLPAPPPASHARFLERVGILNAVVQLDSRVLRQALLRLDWRSRERANTPGTDFKRLIQSTILIMEPSPPHLSNVLGADLSKCRDSRRAAI